MSALVQVAILVPQALLWSLEGVACITRGLYWIAWGRSKADAAERERERRLRQLVRETVREEVAHPVNADGFTDIDLTDNADH